MDSVYTDTPRTLALFLLPLYVNRQVQDERTVVSHHTVKLWFKERRLNSAAYLLTIHIYIDRKIANAISGVSLYYDMIAQSVHNIISIR